MNKDRLNCLGAGLMTAAGAHVLLNLASLPGLFSGESHGVLIRFATVLWALMAVPAGAFVIWKTTGFLNGRSYTEAKLGSMWTMILPLFGVTGAVTAFALIPAGTLALVLLRSPSWRADFVDQSVPQEAEVLEDIARDDVEPESVQTEEDVVV